MIIPDEVPLYLAWLGILAWDLGRYLVVAGAAFGVFWMWQRKRFAHRRIQKPPKRECLRQEVRSSVRTAVIFSLVGLGVYVAAHSGVLRVYDDPAERGWAYFAFTVVALIVLQDTYFYWTHRLMHHPRLFRLFHAEHHRSVSPSPWTAYAFAPLEALTHALFVPMVLLVMPAHQLAVGLFLTFMIVRNVFGHLGIELLPKGFVRHPVGAWNTTTTHHDLHHRRANTNYGLYFTFWDRLMGTTHRDYEAIFERVTSGGIEEESQPKTEVARLPPAQRRLEPVARPTASAA